MPGFGSCRRCSVTRRGSWARRWSGSRRSTESGELCRWRSVRRRSATSRTCRCACSRSCARPMSSLCEDTRRTSILLGRYEIRASALVSNHHHNEERRVAELIPRLVAGERIAIVSDAGLPGVNDPGSLPRPGGDRRRRSGDRAARPLGGRDRAGRRAGLQGRSTGSSGTSRAASESCVQLWAELATWPHPAWRSSHRSAFRQRLPAWLGSTPTRPVAVCRELTKLHEEIVQRLGGRAGEAVRTSRLGVR